jgi:hypothetical protein
MEDSVYINPDLLYDNSVDRADAFLLLRLSDGLIAKRYVTELPEWAKQIIEE